MENKDLLEFDYYLKRMSSILKNSYGVQEQFDMILNFMKEIDININMISDLLDIFTKDYGYITGTTDILDKLAAIFGVSRNFSVTIGTNKYDLVLTNDELLILIKSIIIKNMYKGTYEEQRQLYDMIGLKVYQLNSNNAAECDVILDTGSYVSSNVWSMFNAGIFTFQSLGISYKYSFGDISNFALWDVSEWDVKLWS